jgi:acetylornithine deacetylase/succinyl-diaminopimelate desuccinylase-like protein
MTDSPIYQRPDELLQTLIRFDTTNPPGNEAACIGYIQKLLDDAHIPSTLLGRDPNRPNLIARLPGRGEAPPLLLYGHVDVVTTQGQEWQHPPFAAEIHDDFIWGRGTLDMKGAVAMMVTAFLRAHAEDAPLPADVILCVLSDEEACGDFGANYLVEQHPEQFENVRYALGEAGGFNLEIGGRRFYPIMTGEKQICWMRATLHGPGGHGSMPIRGGAAAKLASFLTKIDRHYLPVHVTPIAREMIDALAHGLGFPLGTALRQLLNPALTDQLLGRLGEQARVFAPLLHNTVSPTIFRGGDKENVIPATITVDLDGRLLPGFAPQDLIDELHVLVGDDITFDVARHDPGPPEPDRGLFALLSDILRESDPAGMPIPLLMAGVTDARFFSRLGIQTYGFTPMQLPKTFNFTETVHAADERIPVGAVAYGADRIYQVLLRCHG